MILEEGILEVGIFRIVSDLVFMMYFVHDFKGGGGGRMESLESG